MQPAMQDDVKKTILFIDLALDCSLVKDWADEEGDESEKGERFGKIQTEPINKHHPTIRLIFDKISPVKSIEKVFFGDVKVEVCVG